MKRFGRNFAHLLCGRIAARNDHWDSDRDEQVLGDPIQRPHCAPFKAVRRASVGLVPRILMTALCPDGSRRAEREQASSTSLSGFQRAEMHSIRRLARCRGHMLKSG